MSIYVCKSVYTEVDVDVDLIEEAKSLSAEEKNELMTVLAGGDVPLGLGDGDQPRLRSIIERAYLAARKLPDLPREIADLFWYVHGRALP